MVGFLCYWHYWFITEGTTMLVLHLQQWCQPVLTTRLNSESLTSAAK